MHWLLGCSPNLSSSYWYRLKSGSKMKAKVNWLVLPGLLISKNELLHFWSWFLIFLFAESFWHSSLKLCESGVSGGLHNGPAWLWLFSDCPPNPVSPYLTGCHQPGNQHQPVKPSQHISPDPLWATLQQRTLFVFHPIQKMTGLGEAPPMPRPMLLMHKIIIWALCWLCSRWYSRI